MPFLFLFLFADVCANLCLVQPNGADAVASCPEMKPGEVALASEEPPVDLNRRLAFHETDRVGHAELWWDAQQQVYVVRQRVTFNQLYLVPFAQFPQQGPDFLTQLPEY